MAQPFDHRLNKILDQLSSKTIANHTMNSNVTSNDNIQTAHNNNLPSNEKSTILIYGDSCTWGYDPNTSERAHEADRWSTVLAKKLNETKKYGLEYNVITEGLNGRTIKEDLPLVFGSDTVDMNGYKQFLPIVHSHKPIDIIVFMLGVNNCKHYFNPTSDSIANQMYELIQLAIGSDNIWRDLKKKTVVFISPATVNHINEINKEWGFDEHSIKVSHGLANAYRKIQVKLMESCDATVKFMDANAAGVFTGNDSVHLTPLANVKLANAVYNIL